MFEIMRGQSKRDATPPYPRPDHVLVPDGLTLALALNGEHGLFHDPTYRCAAFTAGIPGWIHFLRERGLVGDAIGSGAVPKLRPVVMSWLTAHDAVDERMARVVLDAWE